MTREEEIYAAALKEAVKSGRASPHYITLNNFTSGAMWADKNPKENYQKVVEALNEIGFLCMSGAAHTHDFGTRVEAIVREALGL